jgi:hypothetical protein
LAEAPLEDFANGKGAGLASGAGLGIADLAHKIVEATSARVGGTIAHHRHDVGGNDELAIREGSGLAAIDGGGDQIVEAAAGTNGNLAAALKRNNATFRKLDKTTFFVAVTAVTGRTAAHVTAASAGFAGSAGAGACIPFLASSSGFAFVRAAYGAFVWTDIANAFGVESSKHGFDGAVVDCLLGASSFLCITGVRDGRTESAGKGADNGTGKAANRATNPGAPEAPTQADVAEVDVAEIAESAAAEVAGVGAEVDAAGHLTAHVGAAGAKAATIATAAAVARLECV